MAPEVLNGLLRRVPNMRPAVLDGFARWRIPGVDFPAVVRTDGTRTDGLLLEGLDEREMSALDYYEDDGYDRLLVEIEATDKRERCEASVYAWPKERVHQLSVGQAWSYEEWREVHCSAFVRDVVEPCRDAFEAESGGPP